MNLFFLSKKIGILMNIKVVEKDVLDPLAETLNSKQDINPIPYDFETITLLNNTKPGANVILEFLQENLGNRRFIMVKKPAGAPATTKQLENAAEGEIIFLALGDCGSCSSWVVLDAIRLEKMGKPTISICSDKFTSFARELAKAHGFKDLRILGVNHPISGLGSDEIRKKALEILPSLQFILQIP
jgi:hypothetical protein